MATWQFGIWFVGKGYEKENQFPTRNCNLSDLNLSDSSIAQFVFEMPKEKSWDEDLEIRGSMDGNRVDILYEKGIVAEIAARIDIRNIKIKFVIQIVDFAIQNRLSIVEASTGEQIEVDFDSLLSAIMRSPEYKFVVNPEIFLTQIAEHRKKLRMI